MSWDAIDQGRDARRRTSSPRLGQLRTDPVHRSTKSQVTAGRPRGALAGRVRHVDMSKPGRDPGEGKGFKSALYNPSGAGGLAAAVRTLGQRSD